LEIYNCIENCIIPQPKTAYRSLPQPV
jgi:hypothetical protein